MTRLNTSERGFRFGRRMNTLLSVLAGYSAVGRSFFSGSWPRDTTWIAKSRLFRDAYPGQIVETICSLCVSATTSLRIASRSLLCSADVEVDLLLAFSAAYAIDEPDIEGVGTGRRVLRYCHLKL